MNEAELDNEIVAALAQDNGSAPISRAELMDWFGPDCTIEEARRRICALAAFDKTVDPREAQIRELGVFMLPPDRWSTDIEEWLETREYGLALEALAEAVMDYQREAMNSPKVIYAGPIEELLLSPGAFEDGLTAGRVDGYRRRCSPTAA